ncbi:condensin complex subunit 3 [Culicoides brevitarsis]|uniref:condensin complex subunit 3 n=1 Tax=Culicoides brevitarsis TaxID=469753 RepID=UPI00307C50E5
MTRKRKIRIPEATITEENEENDASVENKNNIFADKEAQKMGEIILEAQKNASLHEKCIQQMHKLYKLLAHDKFINVMLHTVQFALTKPLDNIATNCTLEFCAKLFVSFEQDNEEDSTHPVVCDVFKWLLDTTSIDSYVRFRICQFVNTFFNAFNDEAQMDNAIWDNIQKIMIERLRDIDMNVRQQAVLALQRLQDPADPDDKVIKAYMFHMETDPSAKVRRAVISSIAKNQRTIPSIIARLWDADESVRRLAYLQMAKYPVTNFKVIQRIQILDQGLTDQSNLVKKCVAQILLPNWIQVYDGNYLNFISGLKIDATEEDLERFKKIAVNALQEIFRQKKSEDFIKALNLSRHEETKKCVQLDSVKNSVEILVLWQAVIKYLIAYDDEDVDSVLPDMSVIADCLKNFIEEHYQMVEQSHNKLEQMYFQFEILLLLEIINGYDFDDEIGRQALQNILLDILQKVSLEESCIKVVLEILEKIIPNAEHRLELLVNVIRGVTEQTLTFNFEETNKIVDEHLKTSSNVSLMTDLSEIKLEVLELIEKRDTAKERNNHAEALQFQTELENKQEEYKLKIKPILEASKDPSVIALADSLYNRRRLSPETISKCLNICFYMVALKSVKNLTPSVCDLYRKFVCNYLESQDVNYRKLALRVATTYSMLYETLATDVYRTLGKQLISTSSIAIMQTAIQGIFELLDFYGFEKFQLVTSINTTKKTGRTLYNTNADDTEDEDTSIEHTDLINSLLSVLDKCADDSIILATVMGFCRLILHKWITASNIVAKLLLKFFNPATINGVTQILGAFFKELINRRQQELLQQALFPTLKQIIDAPAESPLQDVETTKLVQFVINSTRPEFSAPGLNIHNTIAMHFFNINKDESDSESNTELIKLLAGELHTLEISDGYLRDDFKETVDEFLKDVKDPKIVKNLLKFKDKLTEKSKSIAESSTHNSQTSSSVADDNWDEGESLSSEGQNVTEVTNSVFKVPEARQKPTDTFIPSTCLNVDSTSTEVDDILINQTEKSFSKTNEDALPNILVPATQEQDTFFVTSTQNESNETSSFDSTVTNKFTPKKTVVTRRNKREHPPNSPSIPSPVRKMEKRGAVVETTSANTTRITRKMAINNSMSLSPMEKNKSKKDTQVSVMQKKSDKTIEKNSERSSLPLQKRVSKPTEKAKAIKEKDKKKDVTRASTDKTSLASPGNSPQRLTRSFNNVQSTPKTPNAPKNKIASTSTKKAPEIVPETPPSASKTKTTKKVTDNPDVIPGSPIGLIGLRSLTKKNLRSRNPKKKLA